MEKNEHGIKNAGGTGRISGVYQWLNKVSVFPPITKISTLIAELVDMMPRFSTMASV